MNNNNNQCVCCVSQGTVSPPWGQHRGCCEDEWGPWWPSGTSWGTTGQKVSAGWPAQTLWCAGLLSPRPCWGLRCRTRWWSHLSAGFSMVPQEKSLRIWGLRTNFFRHLRLGESGSGLRKSRLWWVLTFLMFKSVSLLKWSCCCCWYCCCCSRHQNCSF